MKKLIAAAGAALMLAACGGGPAGELTKACVKQGVLTNKQCACVSKEVAAKLDAKALKAFMLQAQGNMAEAQKAMAELSISDRLDATQVQMSAIASCQK